MDKKRKEFDGDKMTKTLGQAIENAKPGVADEQKKRAYAAYKIIIDKKLDDSADSVQKRMGIIKYLEQISGYEFQNTAGFHEKMRRFFYGEETAGMRLKKARREKGWDREAMAAYLGTSKNMVSQMENGHKSLILKALEFIQRVENA